MERAWVWEADSYEIKIWILLVMYSNNMTLQDGYEEECARLQIQRGDYIL